MIPCGHGDIIAQTEVEGWENPTEPAQIILHCLDCNRSARVIVEDVALLDWMDDPFADPRPASMRQHMGCSSQGCLVNPGVTCPLYGER